MSVPKFRAWDKVARKMSQVTAIDFSTKPFRVFYKAYGNENYFNQDAILMQSTMLKDKNGVEIFEGDILDVGNGFINKVDYRLNDGCWRLKSVNGRCLCSYFSNYDSKDEWVIIGNIYENSELLED